MLQANHLIRSESLSDETAIRDVLLAAFPTDAEARLVEALRASNRLTLSLVAEVNGSVAGHIAFSPVTLDSLRGDSGGVGLAPVAVLPGYQRRGIGSQLIQAGLAACASMGKNFAVALGEPDFYNRFGFRRASRFRLGNEYGVDAEFMILALCKGGIPNLPGTIQYAPEFVPSA